jgi:dihydrodipicolinate synthase/N-acetylneuraminate lyase
MGEWNSNPDVPSPVPEVWKGAMVSERVAPPGILCALITPFQSDETPDFAALGELVDFQAERGTQGLFILGTTGEGILLAPEERMKVAAAAMERAAGRIPVIVHAGAADTRTVIDLARHAEDVGADGVAVVAPYYFRYAEPALVRHFARVAEAAPGLSHYVYENPDVVGYAAGIRVVTRLVNDVPNIRGVKDTGDSIAKVTQYLIQPGIRPDVYVGNNQLILPAMVLGARGAVSALANAVPELVTGVYAAARDGHLDDARTLQFALARLHGCVEGVPYVAAVKHLVSRRGLPGGGTRGPQANVTSEQAEAIDRRLAALPELDRWLQPVEGSVSLPGSGRFGRP